MSAADFLPERRSLSAPSAILRRRDEAERAAEREAFADALATAATALAAR